jgi:hypothetical protein
MSSQRQKFFFILIFLAVFAPCAWIKYSMFSLNGSRDYQDLLGGFGIVTLTAGLLATIGVLRIKQASSSTEFIRNALSPDLPNNPLAPPATFRIDKVKVGSYGFIRLEGMVTKGVLQRGMGFKISDDSGIAINFLGKRKGDLNFGAGSAFININVNKQPRAIEGGTGVRIKTQPLAMQASPEDGSLVIVARSFGRVQQNDLQEGMEIEFSDTPEFRAQAAQPLSSSLSFAQSLLFAALPFIAFLFILYFKNPDQFHRLISLFHH